MPVRRQASTPRLTPGQADYVLQRLVSDRRISQGELNRYVAEMHREIEDLEDRLESLKAAAAGGARGRGARPGRPAAVAGPAFGRARRRKARLTPEQAASRKLQGRYLGLIRQIAASKRPQYQKIAKDKGREAAIKEMMSALGK